MSEGRAAFGVNDCSETGYAMPIGGKVIVARAGALPAEHPGQLFLCTGGPGADAHPSGRVVFTVSLSTGEHCQWRRSDVVGALKPGLLPDEAKLYLSQIRPGGAQSVENPEFSGYCFLKDGRYSSGVWLKDAEEAVEFAAMQAPYQHRIMICDRDDFSVMEITQGRLTHISRQVWGAYKQNGVEMGQALGMTMT